MVLEWEMHPWGARLKRFLFLLTPKSKETWGIRARICTLKRNQLLSSKIQVSLSFYVLMEFCIKKQTGNEGTGNVMGAGAELQRL